jgi:hypothetical protein
MPEKMVFSTRKDGVFHKKRWGFPQEKMGFSSRKDDVFHKKRWCFPKQEIILTNK